jgi:hypothetical protein
MSAKPNPRFPRIVAQFCRQRLAQSFPPQEVLRIEAYLTACFASGSLPPSSGTGWAWKALAAHCDIDVEQMRAARDELCPILFALKKEIERAPSRPEKRTASESRKLRLRQSRPKRRQSASRGKAKSTTPSSTIPHSVPKQGAKRGRKPKPRVENPEPLWIHWDEPATFSEALDLHMRRHGDTSWALQAAIARPDETLNRTTIASWRRGDKAPQSAESLRMLGRIERRYRLPAGYFKEKLPHRARSTTGQGLPGLSQAAKAAARLASA